MKKKYNEYTIQEKIDYHNNRIVQLTLELHDRNKALDKRQSKLEEEVVERLFEKLLAKLETAK